MNATSPATPLPPKPQPPVNYDCCGGGCADCELRIYLRELARWNKMAGVASKLAPTKPAE